MVTAIGSGRNVWKRDSLRRRVGPQTIESICSRNENVFVHARYICESKSQGEGELIQDKDIRGVLRFLSYWILKKMGHGIQWQPADDATVEVRYIPSEHPAQ